MHGLLIAFKRSSNWEKRFLVDEDTDEILQMEGLLEEGEIIGESDDGCVKDCMGKKLDDDVEKDIEDCFNNVTEKCEVVNNNMSNNMEGEILRGCNLDGDRGNDTH
ncbi:hypothetical protein Tco_0434870 [Tanacetum coccineum]